MPRPATYPAQRAEAAARRGGSGPRSGRKPIGVFDSGLGGLSIVRALIDLVPGRDLVYFGDTGRFPYGPKPADEVAKFAAQITEVLLERDVAMVVVACNTAAAVALDDLQERVDVPVIGVIEPGIRAAAPRHQHRSRRRDRHGRNRPVGCVPTSGQADRARPRSRLLRLPRIRRVRGSR